MEEQEENRNKRKLDINWEEVLPARNDELPAELIVKKAEQPTTASKSGMSSDDSGTGEEFEQQIPDHELGSRIARMKQTFEKLRRTLPDKGQKILVTVKRLEDEYERRRLRGAEMVCLDVDGSEKPTKSTNSGTSDGFRNGTASSQVQSHSSFASLFSEKMEENKDCRIVKQVDKELSTLAHCAHRKIRSSGELSQKGRKDRSSSRQFPCQCPSNLSCKGDKSIFSNCDQKGRASFTYSSHHTGVNLSSSYPNKKDVFQVLSSNNSRHRKGQIVVLLDEDETQLEETIEGTPHAETIELADELPEFMKDAKIYYPSRDDPESVEICYMDINNLAPKAYLTSPIMNFYIRYLQRQASPTNRAIWDCHFFNTYFYKKLTEAVSHERGDKDSSFAKFRRWWKGVNIFQKAYILIPIHEDLHWSLVIICIPDKEDESGPIILHLDSLELHSSRAVFGNIRSFLKKEWNQLNQEVSPSDLPIADRIWKHLPRRIDEKKIAVPQQENDYDCGLFVLFFMKRFIEEAPERLKKKDLAMFGKRWFRPEEASGLRVKIRNLLKIQFQLACKECCISKSSRSSGDAPA